VSSARIGGHCPSCFRAHLIAAVMKKQSQLRRQSQLHRRRLVTSRRSLPCTMTHTASYGVHVQAYTIGVSHMVVTRQQRAGSGANLDVARRRDAPRREETRMYNERLGVVVLGASAASVVFLPVPRPRADSSSHPPRALRGRDRTLPGILFTWKFQGRRPASPVRSDRPPASRRLVAETPLSLPPPRPPSFYPGCSEFSRVIPPRPLPGRIARARGHCLAFFSSPLFSFLTPGASSLSLFLSFSFPGLFHRSTRLAVFCDTNAREIALHPAIRRGPPFETIFWQRWRRKGAAIPPKLPLQRDVEYGSSRPAFPVLRFPWRDCRPQNCRRCAIRADSCN